MPGRYFAAVDVVDVVPSAVNGLALDKLLGFDFLQIREYETWGIPGSICFCTTGTNPGLPTISAIFDGRRLVIDYEGAPLYASPYETNAIWIGAPPPEFFVDGRESIAYHLVANVVPLPSALWLLAPAISGLGLMRRSAA